MIYGQPKRLGSLNAINAQIKTASSLSIESALMRFANIPSSPVFIQYAQVPRPSSSGLARRLQPPRWSINESIAVGRLGCSSGAIANGQCASLIAPTDHAAGSAKQSGSVAGERGGGGDGGVGAVCAVGRQAERRLTCADGICRFLLGRTKI